MLVTILSHDTVQQVRNFMTSSVWTRPHRIYHFRKHRLPVVFKRYAPTLHVNVENVGLTICCRTRVLAYRPHIYHNWKRHGFSTALLTVRKFVITQTSGCMLELVKFEDHLRSFFTIWGSTGSTLAADSLWKLDVRSRSWHSDIDRLRSQLTTFSL